MDPGLRRGDVGVSGEGDPKAPIAAIDAQVQHRRMLKGFLRAIAAGTLTAAALPAIFWPITILASEQSLAALLSALIAIGLSLVGSLVFVLLCLTLLAIPVALMLRKTGRENGQAYMWAGAAIGFLVIAGGSAFLSQGGAPMLAIIGGVSSAVAASSWWRNCRSAVVAAGS